jgi:hypothetical protein
MCVSQTNKENIFELYYTSAHAPSTDSDDDDDNGEDDEDADDADGDVSKPPVNVSQRVRPVEPTSGPDDGECERFHRCMPGC